jgi:transaldolase
MNPLLQLIEHGQSYWIDNLSRHMITSGDLKKRVSEQGLRGITSNPSIFDKAITKSNDYDAQIKELIRSGKENVKEIYDALTIKDIQDACDILRPVFDESDGLDGFVSLEVSPYLARHTNETMAEARRLFKAVNRPNCLIKIPGTGEGVPAIEQMLYEGININITLLFSIQSYETVARAYIKALERRLNDKKDITKVSSVASFFISRIDVLVDELLHHRIIPEVGPDKYKKARDLLGNAAIASGKIAYQSFKKIFSGSQWEKLEKAGARVQRPLWASTSTKNPNYNDVMYVEPFIGPSTVNTMPEQTIAAFADHGKIVPNSVENDLDSAGKNFGQLAELGIDIDYVTQRLEDEGIQKFIEPYDALLKNLEEKSRKFQ